MADYTFPATGHAVLWTGAPPGLRRRPGRHRHRDPASAAALVTARTVGIIAVDLVGQPADYDELRALADRARPVVIEDAACSPERPTGPPGRQPGRPRGLQLPRPQGHHQRRGRCARRRRRGPDRTAPASCTPRHRAGGHPRGRAPRRTGVRRGRLQLPERDVQAAIMRVQLRPAPDLLAARRRRLRDMPSGSPTSRHHAARSCSRTGTHPWQSYLVTPDAGGGPRRVVMGLRERGVRQQLRHLRQPRRSPSTARRPRARSRRSCSPRQLALPMHAEPDLRRPRLRGRTAPRCRVLAGELDAR